MIGQVRQGRPQPDQGVIGGRDDEGQGVGPLALDGYTWYVRARNGDGATDGVPGWFYIAAEVEPSAPNLRQPYGYNWSPAKLFTVFSGVRPVALTLLASTGVISETTPAYSWSDKGDADEPQVQIQLRGPLDLAWSAVESLSWLFLSATTGSILESPTLSIDTGELFGRLAIGYSRT